MRKIVGSVLLLAFLLVSVVFINGALAQETSELVGSEEEVYYMVTFNSGVNYWKDVYAGFEEAGNLYSVNTEYTGAIQQDVGEATTVLEQVIARNPDGIALSVIDPSAYHEPINRAIEKGIPIVTFDSDAPDSDRYSFLGTGNYEAGQLAAEKFAERINNKGEVGIVTTIGPTNIGNRVAGFVDKIESDYPEIEIVQIGNGGTNSMAASNTAASLIRSNPDLKGIYCTWADMSIGTVNAVREAGKIDDIKIATFDTDEVTLDAIKAGEIEMTIAQGTYNMGYWSLQFLYHVNNNLANPVANWKENNVNPLPEYVDTGATAVTIENVDAFYKK